MDEMLGKLRKERGVQLVIYGVALLLAFVALLLLAWKFKLVAKYSRKLYKLWVEGAPTDTIATQEMVSAMTTYQQP